MESSIQTEHALLEELRGLRARVAELEQAEIRLKLTEEEQRREVERANKALKALISMTQVFTQETDDINSRTGQIVQLSGQALPYSHLGIVLIDPQTDQLRLLTVVGASPEELHCWHTYIDDTCISDHFSDPAVLNTLYKSQPVKLVGTQFAPIFGERPYLLIPLHTGAQLVGLLVLDCDTRTHHLSPDEMEFVETIASLTTLVIEREHLQRTHAATNAKEQTFIEASQRTNEFLSIASHELRTPLTAIKGNIQLVQRQVNMLLLDDNLEEHVLGRLDLIQELLGRADHQVRIQNRLVGDLLDVSRIQTNRLDLHMELCDLLAIVGDTLENQRAATPFRIITLDAPSNVRVPIVADPDRINQVISNYVTNALKYSSTDRPINVRLEMRDGAATVSVQDEGPGLPQEVQHTLWQRFYRVPGIRAQNGTMVGLGLGLYICRTIIERHQGHVGVQSMVGQGSTFWFSLPIYEQ